MIVRNLNEIIDTKYDVFDPEGRWRSRRFLTAKDQMGFSLHDTTIFAGTKTFIHYKHHVEAVYCIEGSGQVELIDEERIIPVSSGTMYALNNHEKHHLVAHTDMRIICVFNPALSGEEVHRSDGSYEIPSGR